MRILRITTRVRDQQEALRFYIDKLGFVKRVDMPMGPTQRWITVGPGEDASVEVVLQPPDWFQGEERTHHEALVGKDPTVVFQVEDCQAVYDRLSKNGVTFTLPPTDRGYGIEADGQDLYGNTLVFLQPTGVR